MGVRGKVVVVGVAGGITLLSLAVLSLSVLRPMSTLTSASGSIRRAAGTVSGTAGSSSIGIRSTGLGRDIRASGKRLLIALPRRTGSRVRLRSNSSGVTMDLPSRFSSGTMGTKGATVCRKSNSSLKLRGASLNFETLVSVASPGTDGRCDFSVGLPRKCRLFSTTRLSNGTPNAKSVCVISGSNVPMGVVTTT